MSPTAVALPRERGPGHVPMLWLIAAMTLVTLPFLSSLPLWLPVALAGIAGWRWHGERRGLPPPSMLTRVAISAAVIAGLALGGSIGLGLEAAVPLYVAFLWIKLLELRGERDVLMGCYLSCFLAGASLLTDQGALRTVYAAVTLVVVVAAALRYQLGRGGASPRTMAVLRKAGLIALQGAPAAVVLFLLLPRPVIDLPLDRGRATSGLSDRMNPGEIASIALSQEPAFRVAFTGGLPPAAETMYWRGLVLTETDGSVWTRNPQLVSLTMQPRLPAGRREDPAVDQEITLLPHQRHWLYALDCPERLPAGVNAYQGVVLFRKEAVQNPLTYQIRSRPERRPVEMSDGYRGRTLAAPALIDPTVLALADEWRTRAAATGIPGARGIAAAGLSWFSEQGFTYTLEPGIIEGDLVAGFLARKQGFCGHYSAAFALLMRLAQVPARVVIGYRGGEWNEPGGFLVVRQSHAHAWTEIWLDNERRWERIDPTAAVTGVDTRRIASEGAQAINGEADAGGAWSQSLRRGRQWWDVVDAKWENWMFRYDADAQQRLRDKLGLGGLDALGATLVALGAALAALVSIALLVRRRRPRRDAARLLYDRWCHHLAIAGCTRAADEGPQAFAARASLALPIRGDEIAAVTAAYVAARYAPAAPEALDRLRAALRAAGRSQAPG